MLRKIFRSLTNMQQDGHLIIKQFKHFNAQYQLQEQLSER